MENKSDLNILALGLKGSVHEKVKLRVREGGLSALVSQPQFRRRFRPSRASRLVSSVLLLAFLLQLLPTAAWGLEPAPPRRSYQPKAKAQSQRPPASADQGLEKALRLAGVDPSRYAPQPRLEAQATTRPDRPDGPLKTPDPEPSNADAPGKPTEATASRPAPALYSNDVEQPEPADPVVLDLEAVEPVPRMPKLFAQRTLDAPPDDFFSRQAVPGGRYIPVTEFKAYTNDHAVFFSKQLIPAVNPGSEQVTWDFLSPVPANNQTSRGTAASVEFSYTSVGEDAASFDSQSTLVVTVWDKRWPEGKVVRTIQTPTHQEQLQIYAGITARDPGFWTFTETSTHQPTTQFDFPVEEPPVPATEWTRWVDPTQSEDVTTSPLVYTNDDWLLRTKAFTFENPSQAQTISWSWLAPDPALNTTSRASYVTIELRYRILPGEQYRVLVRVFDPAFPGGRLVKEETGPGTLPGYTLTYGEGLPVYGAWSCVEQVNQLPPVTTAIEARSLVTSVRGPAAFYPDNGPITYNISIEGFPATFVPQNLEWNLKIRRLDGSQPLDSVREFTGTVADNDQNPVLIMQDWDGADEFGTRVGIGKSFLPELTVTVPGAPPAPFAPFAAAATSGSPGVFSHTFSTTPQTLYLANDAGRTYMPVEGATSKEIDVSTGRYRYEEMDLAIPTRGLPIVIGRYFLSEDQNRAPNFGWRWTFEHRLEGIQSNSVTYLSPSGRVDTYVRAGAALNPTRPDITAQLRQIDFNHYELELKNHIRLVFVVPNGNTDVAVLEKQIDRNGNTLTFSWDAFGQRLNSIQGPVSSQTVTLEWGPGAVPNIFRLDRVTDWTGRKVEYRYGNGFNGDQFLVSVRLPDPSGSSTQEVIEYSWIKQKVPGTNAGLYSLLGVSRPSVGLQDKIVPEAPGSGVLNQIGAVDRSVTDFNLETILPTFTGGPSGQGGNTTLQRRGPDVPTQFWNYFQDEFGRTTDVNNPRGASSRMQLDPANNVLEALNYNDQRSEYTYDESRNPLTAKDALNHTTTFTWNNNNLTSVRDADGEMTFLVYDANNNLTRKRDPLSHTQEYDYNAFGQVTRYTDGEGNSWTFDYNSDGYLTSMTAPSIAGQGSATWIYTVDSLGRRTAVTDPRGNTYRYEWDARDRLKSVTLPAVSSGGEQPALSAKKIVYQWNRNDLLLSVKDPLNRETTYGYDSSLRLTSVLEPGLSSPTRYAYDANSNVKTLTNTNGAVTSYEHDVLNRLTEMRYPTPGGTETYDYDELGNVLRWGKSDGVTINYAYDDKNRLTDVNGPGVSIDYTYDNLDRPLTMVDGTGTTRYSYTADYNLESVQHPFTGTVAYDYDRDNRVVRVTDPQNQPTEYQWDARGRLRSASLDGQAIQYGYDAAGNNTSVSYPNGMECTRTYNQRNQLRSLAYTSNGPLISFQYGYNQVGCMTAQRQTTSARDLRLTYQYDARDEVLATNGELLGGPPGTLTPTTYAYDNHHNRIRKDDQAAFHNAADQLTEAGDEEFDYDGAGNLISRTGGVDTTYDYYTHNNLLRSITGSNSASYVYDGNDQRVEKTVNGETTSYLWSGSEVLKEYSTEGDPKTEYLMGLGRQAIRNNGQWKFYVTDHQGSTHYLVDASGTVTDEYEYDNDYGQTTNRIGTSYNPYRYTGQQYDVETGLYYLRARYYDPMVGRFTTRDPIGYSAGTNVYTYCGGNPVNFMDPSGLEDTWSTPWKITGFSATDEKKVRSALGTMHSILTSPEGLEKVNEFTKSTGLELNVAELVSMLEDPSMEARFSTRRPELVELPNGAIMAKMAPASFVDPAEPNVVNITAVGTFYSKNMYDAENDLVVALMAGHELEHVSQLRRAAAGNPYEVGSPPYNAEHPAGAFKNYDTFVEFYIRATYPKRADVILPYTKYHPTGSK